MLLPLLLGSARQRSYGRPTVRPVMKAPVGLIAQTSGLRLIARRTWRYG
jgi:hypothetical protein